MPAASVLSLTDLPVVPSSCQSLLPALDDQFLHLHLEVLSNAPDAEVHHLFLGVQGHLDVVVAEVLGRGVLLDRGQAADCG